MLIKAVVTGGEAEKQNYSSGGKLETRMHSPETDSSSRDTMSMMKIIWQRVDWRSGPLSLC